MRPKRKAKAPPAEEWTADQIVMRRTDDLKPHPQNPKVHPPEQISALAAVMRQYGCDQPLLVDETDTILKGHGRQLAGREAKLEWLPTILRPGLSEDEKLAIVISDNQLPQLGRWDQSLLRVGLTRLAKTDYPMKLLGFNNVHLATFMGGTAGQRPPNELPALEPAITKPGEVWMMGEHRIICGNCTNAKVVKSIGAGDIKLMATDPPYRVEADGGGIFSDMNHTAAMKRDDVASFEVSQLCALRETNIIFTGKDLLADYLDLAREKKLTWDVGVLLRAR